MRHFARLAHILLPHTWRVFAKNSLTQSKETSENRKESLSSVIVKDSHSYIR